MTRQQHPREVLAPLGGRDVEEEGVQQLIAVHLPVAERVPYHEEGVHIHPELVEVGQIRHQQRLGDPLGALGLLRLHHGPVHRKPHHTLLLPPRQRPQPIRVVPQLHQLRHVVRVLALELPDLRAELVLLGAAVDGALQAQVVLAVAHRLRLQFIHLLIRLHHLLKLLDPHPLIPILRLQPRHTLLRVLHLLPQRLRHPVRRPRRLVRVRLVLLRLQQLRPQPRHLGVPPKRVRLLRVQLLVRAPQLEVPRLFLRQRVLELQPQVPRALRKVAHPRVLLRVRLPHQFDLCSVMHAVRARGVDPRGIGFELGVGDVERARLFL